MEVYAEAKQIQNKVFLFWKSKWYLSFGMA